MLFFSCNKDFLQKNPEVQISNSNFWKTDVDFQTYSLGLYDFFGFGVGNSNSFSLNTDEMVRGSQVQSDLIYNRRTIPPSGGGWNWSRLRSINIMIREAHIATLDQATKNHWEGVGRLFRAREYSNKVKSYGNVPWIDHELTTSSSELYAAQDSRATVMAHVLEDLNFAVQNIRVDAGANLINRYVALAIKSEICLYEGTFRKYHTEVNLNDAATWLNESVSASEAILNSNKFSLSSDYRTIYSSVNLAGNKEAILYKQYEPGVIVNVQSRMLGQRDFIGATRDAVESFLCVDGLPYGVSPTHPKALAGLPEFVEEEFKNRDPRMGKMLVIPYTTTMGPQNNPYLYNTTLTQAPPAYSPALTGESALANPTGYPIYKWFSNLTPNDDVNGILDAPVYTLNTILLNYAEAKAELGQCDDAVLGKSINLLRIRAGMPTLSVAITSNIVDPAKSKYAPEISNLLWEIRRERRVELMFENSRYDDIVRWKKGSYLGKQVLGVYLDLDSRPSFEYNSNGTNKTTVILGDRQGNPLAANSRNGFVLPFILKPPVWSDNDLKIYYTPIDLLSLTLNENLQQSPGW